MAWTASRIFVAYIVDIFANTTEIDLPTTVVDVALFTDAITPSHIVTSANSAYGAGVWAANEVTDTSAGGPAGWPAGGVAIADTITDNTAVTFMYDASVDTASVDAHTTLADVHGCLVYAGGIAAPVADQGMCYNWFGGHQEVTAGTFTIVWNASGIFSIATGAVP